MATKDGADFLRALTDAGGRSGNAGLRLQLGWSEDKYWRVQGDLIEAKEILVGRGRGGSVRLPDAKIETPAVPEPIQEDVTPATRISERSLYADVAKSIRSKWINKFGFDNFTVDETHSLGSRSTGGTFTRPDITIAGLKTYVFLQKTIEIVTIEIKTEDAITVMGVLESIAHRQACHRSYVLYHSSREKFDQSPESDRIFELAQRNGIGIILAEDPSDVETWDIPIEALHNQPDPARLDLFLQNHPNKQTQNNIQKWNR